MGMGSYDDAYITYRYAYNLASGSGLVYNPGEAHLGTTTPLLAVSLGLFGYLTSPDQIPWLGKWFTGIALILLAWSVFLMLKKDAGWIAGTVSSLYLLTTPVLSTMWGGETLWLLFFAVSAIYSYARGRECISAVFCGLAFLTRGEGILIGGLLALHHIITNRRIPWMAGIVMFLVVLPWCLFAIHAFGSPLPGTLQAKQAQLDSGYWGPFFRTSVDWLRAYVMGSPTFNFIQPDWRYGVIVVLAGIGMIFYRKWWKSATAGVLIWVSVYAVGYTLLGIPFYTWYAIPLLLAGLLMAGLGAQYGWDMLGKIRPARFAVLALCLLPAWAGWRSIQDYQTAPVSPVQRLYTNAGIWLRDHTPASSTVGFFEIGYLGYHANRTMIDPMGLATPEAVPFVAKGNFTQLYHERQPDYILLNAHRWKDRIGKIAEEDWFIKAYHEIGRIEEPGYFDAPIVIYQKSGT